MLYSQGSGLTVVFTPPFSLWFCLHVLNLHLLNTWPYGALWAANRCPARTWPSLQAIMESLKEKTAKGLFWGAINNLLMQLIGMAVGIALGRLLDTTDYGMIAMISVFSLVANELQNSGFKAALNNLKQPEHSDYNSVFWFNIGMGLALYALLFLSAPLIAHYYHTPQLVSPAPSCRVSRACSWLGRDTLIGRWPPKPTFTCCSTRCFIGITRTGDPHYR